jgi:hypothetical protein
MLLIGLEQETPEEQNAEDYQNGDDDDLNETHCRFLSERKSLNLDVILITNVDGVNPLARVRDKTCA